jgi:hypothetical protein
MNFDQILKHVREDKEFFVPFSSEGMGIERANGGKVSKADVGAFFRHAKARFRKRNPIAPNQADYVNWVLYDEITYAAAATVPNLSRLFVVPIGGAKTKVQTNLEVVGALPAPQWFNCTGFALHIRPNVAPVDLDAYLNSAYLEFWVSQKVYLEGRMDMFPQAGGIIGGMVNAAAAATGTTQVTNGWPSVHNLYDLRLPAGLALGRDGNGTPVVADGIIGVTILQSQTFRVDLKSDGGGAVLVGAAAVPFNGTGLTVGSRLHGILSRGVQ